MPERRLFTTPCFARIVAVAGLIIGMASSARAGGPVERLAFTSQPSPIPGHVIVRTVPARWTEQCVPVRWRVNDAADPIPNPFVDSPISLAAATAAVQRALDTWNDVPASFIESRIVGTVSNTGAAGYDFVNEIQFTTDSVFGSTFARVTTLVEDAVLSDGDDLNGDGVPDVSGAIAACQDVMGRTKLPAGSYAAGTILDADLVFDTANHTPVTVDDVDVENPFAHDLQGLALHELGHALGLGHSVHTQRSDHDGRDAVMGGQYPFDPVFELLQRSLDSDDIAWISYLYPEGIASTGPAALQAGDSSFASEYGIIRGTLHHGRYDLPIPGGVVFAENQASHEIVASGFTGSVLLSGDPITGEVTFLPAETGVIDGGFIVPVPAGTYVLHVRATGLPPYPLEWSSEAGRAYGLLDFHEEAVDRRDDAIELRPDQANPVYVRAGRTSAAIKVVTNRTLDVNGFGDWDFLSLAALEDAGGTIPFSHMAVRIPSERLAALIGPRGTPILAAHFLTAPFDPSAVQTFPEAMLARGHVNADGTAVIDLADPLASVGGIVGRDFAFTPVYFKHPVALGRHVKEGLASGQIGDLFVVLAIPPPPYPGPSGMPPFIGRACHFAVRETLSYFTLDGVTFRPLAFCEILFSLIVADPSAPKE